MKKKILFTIISVSSVCGGLIHPPDGSELSYIHVMFRWDAEDGITDYTFELSSSSDFSPILISTNIADTKLLVDENIDWQSTYYWRNKPIDGTFSAASSFTTSSPSYQFSGNVSPVNIQTYNSELAFDGITIYGIMSPFYSAAIDMNGDEVWNSGELGENSYMFTYVDTNHTFLGDANLAPNYKGELGIEFTIEGGVTWSQPTYGDAIDFLQHEMIKLPNGNYMGFSPLYQEHFVPNSDDFSQFPSNADFSFENNIPGWDGSFDYPWTWKGDRIVEWDIDGNEVWSWNPFNESYGFNLNDFDFMSGFWEHAVSSNDPFDWTHFNALAYDEDEDMIYVSSKNLSRITKIERATNKIIWNIGIPWLGEELISSDPLFSGQHGLQLLDNGNLVFFDNGILSGRLDGSNEYYSTAIEMRINDNNGEYSAETIWSYTLPGELYGVISGNVQKLENGNYFITTVGKTDGAYSLEITPSYEIVWKCKYNVGTPQGSIYRAMRIPSLYDPTYYTDLSVSMQHLPNSFAIKSVYPNPFNPTVTMEYELSQSGYILGNIYNFRGQLIENLFSDYKNIGYHIFAWDASNYPSGIYLFQLKNKSLSLSQKLMLVK